VTFSCDEQPRTADGNTAVFCVNSTAGHTRVLQFNGYQGRAWADTTQICCLMSQFDRGNDSAYNLTTPCLATCDDPAKSDNPWYLGWFAEMGLSTTVAGQVIGKGGFADTAAYKTGAAPTIACDGHRNLTIDACRLQSPQDAYACNKAIFHCLVNKTYNPGPLAPVPRQTPEKNPIVSMLGHQLWHHYVLQWGLDLAPERRVKAVGSEVGENIDSIQLHIAFTRGAAKQYNVPWFVDFSDWYSGTMHGFVEWPNRTYIGNGHCPDGCGHTISLNMRAKHVIFASGANAVLRRRGTPAKSRRTQRNWHRARRCSLSCRIQVGSTTPPSLPSRQLALSTAGK